MSTKRFKKQPEHTISHFSETTLNRLWLNKNLIF